MSNRIPVKFVTRHRAKFDQIDPYGHLNSTAYLATFFEHRFTGMREVLGLDLNRIMDLPVAFYTSEVNLKYRKPVLMDQEFTIESHILELRSTDATILCEMKDVKGSLLSSCTINFVCFDKKTMRSAEWPAEVTDIFYESEATLNHEIHYSSMVEV